MNSNKLLQCGLCSGLKTIWIWIDLRKAGHKAPTYRQMSNYCMQQDGVLLPRKDQLSSYS
jgi:hypothetical protein